MGATWAAFLGLTVIVAALVSIVVFAMLRFSAAAREAKNRRPDRAENLLLSSAIEEAIGRLKAQQQASAARAEASERLSEQIVTSLTSGLVVVDARRQVRIANPAAYRILNATADQSTPLLDGVPELAAVIDESLSTQSPVLRRTISLPRSAETKHLGVSVSLLGNEGAPEGAICLFTDLTEVVALEEQLRLKEALARLGELTAGLAHEFRNGLATIHGYARLMDPQTLAPPVDSYVSGIRAETQALGEIVTNFLNFARPDALTLAPAELRGVIERASEDAPAARISIAGEFALVDADEVLLRQAISNLFRNSVEACSAAGVAPKIEVEGRLDRAAGLVSVDVADNGPGIQPDALTRLFRPFFTTKPGGTGLGLAIVQKIIVSHNGRITAANRDSGGAVFRVQLPLHKGSHPKM